MQKDLRTVKGVNVERYFFDSIAQMQGWIDTTKEVWPSAYRQSRTLEASSSWDLNTDYAEAAKLAREGWIKGAEKAQGALKAFKTATPAPDQKNDFYGFKPHVPRYCAGAPDSMVRHTTHAETGCGKVLTLIVPVDAAAMTAAQHMSNFGVAVAQYVNQMEMDGTRVELVVAMIGLINGRRVSFCVRIKYADQPLDLAVVAYAIGHPAFFRRLGFALIERCDATPTMGYGRPMDAEPDDMINAPYGAVVLNGMKNAGTHASTPEKGFEYVEAQITAKLAQIELGA